MRGQCVDSAALVATGLIRVLLRYDATTSRRPRPQRPSTASRRGDTTCSPSRRRPRRPGRQRAPAAVWKDIEDRAARRRRRRRPSSMERRLCRFASITAACPPHCSCPIQTAPTSTVPVSVRIVGNVAIWWVPLTQGRF